MNWLDKILLPQETIELGELNRIWEAFNDKKLTAKQTQIALLQREWKHHTEKAKLLLDFTNLIDKKDVE
jgi:hypothetical protein